MSDSKKPGFIKRMGNFFSRAEQPDEIIIPEIVTEQPKEHRRRNYDFQMTTDNGSAMPIDADISKENIESSFNRIMDSIANYIVKLLDGYGEGKYLDSFLPVFTLEDCLEYFERESARVKDGTVVDGFLLKISDNPDPRNTNDYFVVTQALYSEKTKTIMIDDKLVARMVHVGKVDERILEEMDGRDINLFLNRGQKLC